MRAKCWMLLMIMAVCLPAAAGAQTLTPNTATAVIDGQDHTLYLTDYTTGPTHGGLVSVTMTDIDPFTQKPLGRLIITFPENWQVGSYGPRQEGAPGMGLASVQYALGLKSTRVYSQQEPSFSMVIDTGNASHTQVSGRLRADIGNEHRSLLDINLHYIAATIDLCAFDVDLQQPMPHMDDARGGGIEPLEPLEETGDGPDAPGFDPLPPLTP